MLRMYSWSSNLPRWRPSHLFLSVLSNNSNTIFCTLLSLLQCTFHSCTVRFICTAPKTKYLSTLDNNKYQYWFVPRPSAATSPTSIGSPLTYTSILNFLSLFSDPSRASPVPFSCNLLQLCSQRSLRFSNSPVEQVYLPLSTSGRGAFSCLGSRIPRLLFVFAFLLLKTHSLHEVCSENQPR